MRRFLLFCVLSRSIRKSGIKRLAFVFFRLRVKFYHLLGVLVCTGRQSKSFLPASAKQGAPAPHTSCARQFVSRLFVVLLRKSFPQKANLQTAAELGVK
jgi:hypothetical protein